MRDESVKIQPNVSMASERPHLVATQRTPMGGNPALTFQWPLNGHTSLRRPALLAAH